MVERVRYYLDEHVSRAVAQGLKRRGVDVATAAEMNMLAATDIAHLRLAADEDRVIFSQDTDFLRLHAAGHPHAGIVFATQQTGIGTIVGGLMLIFELVGPDEMKNHVEFI